MKDSTGITFALSIIPLFLTSITLLAKEFNFYIVAIWVFPLTAWLIMYVWETDASKIRNPNEVKHE